MHDAKGSKAGKTIKLLKVIPVKDAIRMAILDPRHQLIEDAKGLFERQAVGCSLQMLIQISTLQMMSGKRDGLQRRLIRDNARTAESICIWISCIQGIQLFGFRRCGKKMSKLHHTRFVNGTEWVWSVSIGRFGLCNRGTFVAMEFDLALMPST